MAPAEVYDPAADRWTDLADLPRARNHLAGYVDGGGHPCVAGGREPDTSTAVDCFDPATGDVVGRPGAAGADVGRAGRR